MYTRQSAMIELARTSVGRLLRAVIAQQAKKGAGKPSEASLYAGAVDYLTLEQVVFMSRGKVPWPVADSIVDLANGQPSAVLKRIGTAVGRRISRRSAGPTQR